MLDPMPAGTIVYARVRTADGTVVSRQQGGPDWARALETLRASLAEGEVLLHVKSWPSRDDEPGNDEETPRRHPEG